MTNVLSTPEEIIAAYLVSLGLAARPPAAGQPAVTWPITTQKMPDAPDSAIKASLSESVTMGKLMDDGDPLVYPRVTLLIRSLAPRDAYARGVQISNALSALSFATVTTNLPEDVVVQAVTILNPLQYIGQEEQNRRQLYTLTVQLSLE